MTIQVQGSDLTIEFDSILKHNREEAIAIWGNHLGLAELEHAQAENFYRAWYAKTVNDTCAKSKKGTPPEWRVKAKIEMLPNFATLKDGVARAKYHVQLLTAIYAALTNP